MSIDAQFSRAEAVKLAQRIRASGKRLTTIYISHGDPDFYFGLDVLQKVWLKTLDSIDALHPVTVVPGHFMPGLPMTPDSVSFTRAYVTKFVDEAAKAADAAH